MKDGDLIQTVREGACLTVTINRPGKANSLTRDMLIELQEIFRGVAQDSGLRAVVLTGTGNRVFCAGADLNTLFEEFGGPDPWQGMAMALRAIPVLTIAAINGPCIGGGLTLALGCDMRIAVHEARFSYPVLRNHVLPGRHDLDRLQALLGPGRSAAILLGGAVVEAREAADWGLVDRVVPREVLIDNCKSLYATALAADGRHLKSLKSMLGASS